MAAHPAARPPGEALANAVAELTAEVAELREDRVRRRLLDLASGVLVQQLGLTPADAADHLVELALSTGLSAEDLAADVINSAAGTPVVENHTEARRIRRSVATVLVSDTAAEAAASLLQGGLRRLGAQALYLWRRTATDCLELVGHAGAAPQEVVHWQWVPPETPLHQVVWAAESWWGADPRLPGGGAGLEGEPLRAVMPLRRHGAVVGVALAVWPGASGPGGVDEAVRRTAELLCEPCGVLVQDPDAAVRSRGPGPEAPLLDLFDRPAVLTDEEGRIEYANPAARTALDSTVPAPVGRSAAEVFPHAWAGLAAALDRVGPQFLGRVADLEDVRVLPLGRGRAVLMWATRPEDADVLARALGQLERVAFFREDLLTGSVVWSDEAYTLFGLPPGTPPVPLARVGTRLHPDDVPVLQELLAALVDRHTGAWAPVRLVRADGGVRHVRIAAEPLLTGDALTGVTGVYQDVSAQHHTELALSASADRLSAARTDALVREHLVLRLQQAISPSLRQASGLEVAVRYRPAVEDHRVGGDWYEVQELSDGRVLLAVGDVAGHGIEAASAMVGLRHALRGLAVTSADPGRLMSWLNEVTLATPDHPTATAVVAEYDPAEHLLRWATAGHLPLLLIRDGRARFLEGPQNILLGALPGGEYAESEVSLAPGDTLLLFTDGFVERRHVGLDQSLAVLRRTAEALVAVDPEGQADALLSAVTGDTDDDTSLVVVRVPGETAFEEEAPLGEEAPFGGDLPVN
ncbi:SpoIIE family protein phosphatase [Streptomyces sp. WAC06614]|uniref:SpoIIE family protein phosphatase n=1 Tax=Streptomyces sp. WAC06614 TaxID=2487416 RepID=UPI000F7B7C1D|nr:SpoIIE family protein phosphatase [Streptomyces sp. WAC06614]RSS72834.1 ANTAR domain-containing protein [Streptomyces sp. WAC06614]